MTGQPRSPLALARLGLLAVFLTGAAVALLVLGTDGLRSFIDAAGSSRWGFIAFVAAYAIAVVLLMPGTVGTMSAGAIFGFGTGSLAAVLGASIGATGAFFVSRALGRDGAKQLLGDQLSNVDDWVAENDFVSILVLRLMPIVPFSGLNYAAGLTAARPSRYVAATVVGIVPGVLLASALGDAVSDPTSPTFVLLVIAVAIALTLSVVAARRMRRQRSM